MFIIRNHFTNYNKSEYQNALLTLYKNNYQIYRFNKQAKHYLKTCFNNKFIRINAKYIIHLIFLIACSTSFILIFYETEIRCFSKYRQRYSLAIFIQIQTITQEPDTSQQIRQIKHTSHSKPVFVKITIRSEKM